jgi:hypothetical protein
LGDVQSDWNIFFSWIVDKNLVSQQAAQVKIMQFSMWGIWRPIVDN